MPAHVKVGVQGQEGLCVYLGEGGRMRGKGWRFNAVLQAP
jgi:hypothetical protein